MMAMTRELSDAWILCRIPQLSPKSAQGVIEQGEKSQLRLSPAVMTALLEQAGKRPVEPTEPPESGAPPQALPEPATAYEVEDAEEIQEPPKPTAEDLPF